MQHSEIMVEFAPAIFTTLHIGFEIAAEQRDLDLQSCRDVAGVSSLSNVVVSARRVVAAKNDAAIVGGSFMRRFG